MLTCVSLTLNTHLNFSFIFAKVFNKNHFLWCIMISDNILTFNKDESIHLLNLYLIELTGHWDIDLMKKHKFVYLNY